MTLYVCRFIKKFFLLFSFVIMIYAQQDAVKNYEQLVQEHEDICKKVINEVFRKAQISLDNNEDIITLEWLSCVKEIRYTLSDSCIELGFNKIISEKIQFYLQDKIRREVDKIFEKDSITSDQVKQFFYLSGVICELSQGINCHEMIQTIKNENFPCKHNLKTNYKVKKQEIKEERQELCKYIVLGAIARK